MFFRKRVKIDVYLLDELKDLLGINDGTEAVDEAVRRVIELEEACFILDMARRLRPPEGWEQDPDAWKGGPHPPDVDVDVFPYGPYGFPYEDDAEH